MMFTGKRFKVLFYLKNKQAFYGTGLNIVNIIGKQRNGETLKLYIQ